jgi:hypothetical protein
MTDAHLTADETAALALYYETHGEAWKERLAHDWRTGRDVNALPGDHGCYLRSIRNRLGPSWLAEVKL